MFARVSNASKVALAALVAYLRAEAFGLIDCQVTTGHLQRMGAREIPRSLYLEELQVHLQAPTRKGKWKLPAEVLTDFFPKPRVSPKRPGRRGIQRPGERNRKG
jgi:leucyl/phenylalanyl-tRNA--protein transferase